MDVTELKSGEKARVITITGGWGLLRKLDALGVRRDTEITKMSSQVLRGPVIIKIKNVDVAIGFGMAKKIIINKV